MTDLLLITDVPRLRKIFSQLADDKGITLRMAPSLERGSEELIARKPTMVFVQTHLSGLSADILLMHLKKQLGRKRSRFVLLSPPSQVSADTIKLYQGHIDTSLNEKALLEDIRRIIATLTPQKGRSGLGAALAVEDIVATSTTVQASPLGAPGVEPAAGLLREPEPVQDILAVAALPAPPAEPSLADQGITYAPRSRVKVYSEFTSSFDSAVESMQEPELPAETAQHSFSGWDMEHLETIEPEKRLSRRFSFLLWMAPVLVAAVVVTVIQNRKPEQKTVAVITEPPPKQVKAALQPAAPAQPPAVTTPKPAVSPVTPVAGASPKTAVDSAPPLSDKAVLSDLAENRSHTEAPTPGQTASRPGKLPDFIPRYAMDKHYSAANPGWERYKGQVTEFKVFREKESIKAIQVIDRGGDGVPESFMKAALRQVAKKPAFVLESSEKKGGYEIQRGHINGNLKVVYYRDEQGGRLRAFVMTWQ